jgi:photosystem II stability/assembly factor-like uncharacterized protein
MGNTNYNPAVTGYSRVFLIEGRARVDHQPQYYSFLRMTGLTQGFGDIERIEAPDPGQYGSFIEIGSIRGATARPTASLEGIYAIDLLSEILRLAKKGCPVDVQVHFGSCTDPSSFNSFKKAVVFEGATITNFSTDDLGALASGDNASINETGDISGIEVFEVVPLGFSSVAGDLVTTEVVDVIIADAVSCGDCNEESDGASKIFAITVAAGGSPGTSPDILYSLDKGGAWYADDIDTLSTAQNATGVAKVGDYIVVISDSAASESYADFDDFDDVHHPTWTEVTTGFVAGYTPKAIDAVGNKAFIVGLDGAIYVTEDPTSGVTAISLGSVTAEDLLAVDMLNEDMAVAVGQSGTVVYTLNGTTWNTTAAIPVGAGVHLYCVLALTESEWIVGTSNGRLYYTLNAGDSWTQKAFPGSGTGIVYAIAESNKSVIYIAHTTAATAGRILRSYDGGYSWNVLPEATGSIPANDRIVALAANGYDVNLVVGVGLGDTPPDGIIVIGTG